MNSFLVTLILEFMSCPIYKFYLYNGKIIPVYLKWTVLVNKLKLIIRDNMAINTVKPFNNARMQCLGIGPFPSALHVRIQSCGFIIFYMDWVNRKYSRENQQPVGPYRKQVHFCPAFRMICWCSHTLSPVWKTYERTLMTSCVCVYVVFL